MGGELPKLNLRAALLASLCIALDASPVLGYQRSPNVLVWGAGLIFVNPKLYLFNVISLSMGGCPILPSLPPAGPCHAHSLCLPAVAEATKAPSCAVELSVKP